MPRRDDESGRWALFGPGRVRSLERELVTGTMNSERTVDSGNG